MASDSTTGWPIADERPTLALRPARRSRTWPAWLLTTLAFICGALVSAAVFTVGWRHQTQRNTAAESALAAATARNHALANSLATARATVKRDNRIAAEARASAQTLATAGASVARQAATLTGNAKSVSGDAGTMATAAGKIASELKTLTSYLTTTPPNQLDAGYIDSQAAYLAQQVQALQTQGATMGTATAHFDAAVRELGRLAAGLSAQK